jgi:lysophospholipase L1-like esterase
MILSDGIHMTEEAHERVAAALLPVVAQVAQSV